MGGDASIVPAASHATLQNATWSGSLPVVLSLAPASLSSPAPPRPIHKMISRVSYLHVALHEDIMELSRHATSAPGAGLSAALGGLTVEEPPDSDTEGGGDDRKDCNAKDGSDGANASAEEDPSKNAEEAKQSNNTQAAYPECWFEDAESGTPLRWHLFVGVLYDLMKGRAMTNNSSGPTQSFLPWRIKVHFASYPKDDLLPLDDGSLQPVVDDANNKEDGRFSRIAALVGRLYRNSLKQSLFLQYGSSKVAMSITKSSHEKIWEAVLQSNCGAYQAVNAELQSGINEPAISAQSTDPSVAKEDQNDVPQLIPVRLMLNGGPAIQRPIKHEKESNETEQKRPMEVLETLGTVQPPQYTTLGDFLADLLPQHFALDPSTGSASPVADSAVYYSIQGVQPRTTCALVDLWRACSHPDHFLYITVVTE